MRLASYHKQAFVRAVMQDVPQVDYDAEARKIIEPLVLNALPPEIKKIAQDKKLVGWLATVHFWTLPVGNGHYFSNGTVDSRWIEVQHPQVYSALEAIKEQARQQHKDRRELEATLTGVVNGCSSRAALLKALPEFEKYLPADEPKKATNQLVVANVVTDFVKAGWPKKGGAQ